MTTAGTFTRKPLFWTCIAALAIASAVFTYNYFTHSNPLIKLTLTMDRQQALAKAQEMTLENSWLPATPRTAIKFESDTLLQFFTELECGGKEQFMAMIETKLFEPYTWHVRQFNEKTTEELNVAFSPDGTPYRFSQKLSEAYVKSNLPVSDARTLAVETARTTWNVNFKHYKEIETSKDEKPCGRIDHTFVYERTDAQLGTEGRYRLRLIVSGDTVTEVNPFVFIPETFKRRYNEMRSSNETISTLGTMGFMLLYLFLGCIIGGFYFFRKKFLVPRQALIWAVLITALAGLAALNNVPFVWMSYNTATSITSFLSQHFITTLCMLAATGVFLFVAFSAALTWDRLAFPERLNFWKLWSPTTGASLSALGQTAGGYAFAVIFLGLATGIYLFLTKTMGWWSPADTLTDPNILATYLPWVGPVATSLQAGFMEEALFRAVPIASAAVIGRYYKKENVFIFIAFILQAFIFAACHANYPQQPGYFRLVELLIPSWIFGALYILFGLLPGLLAHFLYDLFLMTLPVMISHSPYAWINKLMVCLVGMVPVAVIFYRRTKQSVWITPTSDQYNNYQQHAEQQVELPKVDVPTAIDKESFIILPQTHKLLYVSGVIGAVLCLLYWPSQSDTPALTLSQEGARAIGQSAFEQQHIETTPDMSWQALPFVAALTSEQEKFIWQTQEKETYQALLGSYLTPPVWAIRYASFTGDLITRAKEFSVVIGPDNKIMRTNLIVPESEAGATLIEAQARGIALEAVIKNTELTVEQLREISAVAQDRPARKDWVFTFQDTSTQLEHEGQARIVVTLAGDQVTNVYQCVFVPESWRRLEQEKDVQRSLLTLFFFLLKSILLLIALFYMQKRFFSDFKPRKTIVYGIALVCLALLLQYNNLPQLIATSFTTMKPYSTQLFIFCATPALGILILGLFAAFCLINIKKCVVSKVVMPLRTIGLMSIAGCLAIEGASAVLIYYSPRFMPYIPNYQPINNYSPLLSVCMGQIVGTIITASLFALAAAAVTLFTQNWTQHKVVGFLFIFLLGVSNGFTPNLYTVTSLLCALLYGILFTALYFLLFRKDQTSILLFFGTRLAVGALLQGIAQVYPFALLYNCIAAVLVLAGAFGWAYTIRKRVPIES